MNKFNIVIFSLLLFIFNLNKINAQDIQIENRIFETMILNQVSKGSTNFYVSCDRPKTFFKVESFLEQSTLKDVPKNILHELEKKYDKYNEIKQWDCNLLKELKLPEGFLISDKCLASKKKKIILENTKERITVFTISNPIFDDKKEHCIVDVVISKYKGSFQASSYILKFIYGKWVILEEFGFVIS